jgi:hypothetical protein
MEIEVSKLGLMVILKPNLAIPIAITATTELMVVKERTGRK